MKVKIKTQKYFTLPPKKSYEGENSSFSYLCVVSRKIVNSDKFEQSQNQN